MKYLGNSPENIFQRIRKMYIGHYGKVTDVLNAATGQPDSVPPMTLRKLVAKWVLNEENQTHTYWDNDDPGEFCMNMIRRVARFDVKQYEHLATLVLPGEKSMLPLMPITCAAKQKNLPKVADNEGFIRTIPSYDLLETWADYIDAPCQRWPLYSAETFRLNLKNLPKSEKPPRLIVVVKPGNPCPVGASREEWVELIEYCLKHQIRLVNDGAYASLIHGSHVPLCQVAAEYPDLEWMEIFSASKALSACGWRLGSAVGSADFITELAKVKGNADSGPFGPALNGMAEYFRDDIASTEMEAIQKMYERRLKIATKIFTDAGFKLACPSDAGFFMLFHCPKMLDGKPMKDNEQFNLELMQKVDLVGVPFAETRPDGSEGQFIRFSACIDYEDEAFADKMRAEMKKITIGY